jgi:homoserine kinase type II
MAVYTVVDSAQAAALLRHLKLGSLMHLEGIRSGIENTNYFADTDQGRWVLTLFERLPRAELPYFLRLMQHLSRAGLPVPLPMGDAAGELVHTLAGKPAAVVTRVSGSPRLAPDIAHCARLGEMLGRMHRAAASFPLHQAHTRGLAWWREVSPQILPHLGPGQVLLLNDEIAFQLGVAASPAGVALPRGPIHADLFRDNVMFDERAGADTISGLLDFYFAGDDALLFDVAVCINDWCVDLESGRIIDERAEALLAAYRTQREWAHGEWRLLPAMLRAAALRFWISRLWDLHLPREARLLEPKSPAHFERMLRERIHNPWLPAT